MSSQSLQIFVTTPHRGQGQLQLVQLSKKWRLQINFPKGVLNSKIEDIKSNTDKSHLILTMYNSVSSQSSEAFYFKFTCIFIYIQLPAIRHGNPQANKCTRKGQHLKELRSAGQSWGRIQYTSKAQLPSPKAACDPKSTKIHSHAGSFLESSSTFG